MTTILDWRHNGDSARVIQRAVRALTEGRLVLFPSHTAYNLAASALAPAALERLAQAADGRIDPPLTLAVPSAGQALDWIERPSPLGRRLARRCWPGPVCLIFREGVAGGLASRLPDPVRRRFGPEQGLPICVPEHEALAQALQQLPVPMVLSSTSIPDDPAAHPVEQLDPGLRDDVALVIDDPASRSRPFPTVVRIDGNHWQVLHEGLVPTAELERQTTCLIVFVCTGNTCRSPLAEGLCKKLLAQRLQCPPEELPQRGFLVLSAGLAAMMGDSATPEAVVAAQELGADLRGHVSRPLTPDLAAQADYLFTMTRGHLALLAARFSQAGCRPRLLSPDGSDVSDPIGCEQPVYQECAQQILHHLEGLLPEFQQS